MKNISKFLALALCLCLLATTVPSAYAVSAELDYTKNICKSLDKADIIYTLYGVDDEGTIEYIDTQYEGDNMPLIDLFVACDSVYNEITVYSFGIIEYDPDDYATVLRVCNALNSANFYPTYICEYDDNEIYASMMVSAPTKYSGDILLDTIDKMAYALDCDYPTLLACAK